MHLVFLIHGLLGSPSHMLSMKESIKEAMASSYGKEVVVYRAQSMSALATLDGVRDNAKRLFAELTAIISERKVTHLSIVGYSLGGLCGRYLVGLLQDARIFAAVTPVLFATFATPHLGSVFSKEGTFGKVFNALGARITGETGFDLFGLSSLLDDLADPDQPFYRGLEQFHNLFLFANAFGDHTVNFWTSYLAPKNPFESRSHLDLHVYEAVPVIVDMNKSRCVDRKVELQSRPLQDRALRNSIKLLLPVAGIILVGAMGTLTVISKTRHLVGAQDLEEDAIKRSRHRSRGSETVAGGVGAALDDTLDIAGPDNGRPANEEETEGTPQPALDGGLEGLVESAPSTLFISSASQAQLEALNKLPWRKYAVSFSRIRTHGDIVDRKKDSAEGKQLMTFFARKVVECHAEHYRRASKL